MPISRDRILYEDIHLLAINKLAGELVVKGSGKTEKLPLLDFLKKEYPGLRPIHRLDFETSGVVVFAKSKEAYEKVIGAKFVGWKKIYRALVLGKIHSDAGEIAVPLPSRGSPEKIPAVTKYRVVQRFTHATDVEAEIESGRHHQIRRHFAAIKHPLLLDEEYGDRKFNRLFTRELKFRRFFLHAARVECVHPITGVHLVVEAPLPKPFVEVRKKLI
ncbi:MAG TPA: pseudouridine synthase [Candidatus Peribacterales bacterium]|nr:pseudouridine synthase [Candidatus Peribacterales bacterium]